MALLYLVTQELLVERHEKPDTPLISAMFFVGFLGLLLIEEHYDFSAAYWVIVLPARLFTLRSSGGTFAV